jgi:hypothetical protein
LLKEVTYIPKPVAAAPGPSANENWLTVKPVWEANFSVIAGGIVSNMTAIRSSRGMSKLEGRSGELG